MLLTAQAFSLFSQQRKWVLQYVRKIYYHSTELLLFFFECVYQSNYLYMNVSLKYSFLACDMQSDSMGIECDSMSFDGKLNKPGSCLETIP